MRELLSGKLLKLLNPYSSRVDLIRNIKSRWLSEKGNQGTGKGIRERIIAIICGAKTQQFLSYFWYFSPK
jgi:hypothetical protein